MTRSNGFAGALVVSEAAVGKHIGHILTKLDRPLQRVDELGHVPDPVLEQVADPGSVAGVRAPSATGSGDVIRASGTTTAAIATARSSGHSSVTKTTGTPVSLRVVAILAPSLSGVSLVVDSGNADGVMPSAVYVRLRPGSVGAGAAVASLRAVAGQADALVVPVSRWSAAASDQRSEQNQGGLWVAFARGRVHPDRPSVAADRHHHRRQRAHRRRRLDPAGARFQGAQLRS